MNFQISCGEKGRIILKHIVLNPRNITLAFPALTYLNFQVKSRNAHMKTHGKQAQEKRRQREEAAARRREEMANRQLPAPHRPVGPHLAHPNFIHPSVSAGKLYPPHPQHHHLQPALPESVMPRYSTTM